MFKFFIFIFLGLFVNMNDVYSEFFMPQNARSDTTSVNNIRAVSRIPNNSKSNYEAKKTFANKKQVIKQKTPRKLFMATQSEVQKKENVNRTIFVKEMNDMEKELKFYQQIILKCVNKEITRDELETLISKNLKTFKKKKLKHLSYDDLYQMVCGLAETVDTNNKK